MLAVKLPSCVSVALPPGSQGAARDGLIPELQAAYVLLWLTWTVSPRTLVSRVRLGAVLDATEVLGRQTPYLEQAPAGKSKPWTYTFCTIPKRLEANHTHQRCCTSPQAVCRGPAL